MSQELSEGGEMAHADLVRDAKVKELDAWKLFKVFKPLRAADVNKTAADTRRAFTWKMVEGGKAVKARLLEGAFRNLTWKMALWIP